MAEAEATDDETAAPKKGNNKIIPIILVVNTLMMTGVLIFVMKRPAAQASAVGKDHVSAPAAEHGEAGGKDEPGAHGPGAETGPGPTLRFENFIIQVRSTEGDRYAHLTIEVEVATEADKKPFESRMPRIRDSVIGYLADRSEDELRGSEGLAQVKEALVKKIDEIVPGHRIRGLFITEFIIQ